jgi:hypothetical protein
VPSPEYWVEVETYGTGPVSSAIVACERLGNVKERLSVENVNENENESVNESRSFVVIAPAPRFE